METSPERAFTDEVTTNFPSPIRGDAHRMSEDEKIEAVAGHFSEIMQILGLDLNDESLAKTPYRVAKMYVKEIFSGLQPEYFPKVSFIEDRYKTEGSYNFVFSKVHFTSFCEHHFVPMVGVAYVAYLPHKKLIGLSKIPRIVRFFSRRPQVQERLNAQIADSLCTLLETEDVAVSMSAQHYCVVARGIEDQNSHTTTQVLRGKFQSDAGIQRRFFEAMDDAPAH